MWEETTVLGENPTHDDLRHLDSSVKVSLHYSIYLYRVEEKEQMKQWQPHLTSVLYLLSDNIKEEEAGYSLRQ